MKVRLLLIAGMLAAVAPLATFVPGAVAPAGASAASWTLNGGAGTTGALDAIACIDASECVAAGTNGTNAVAIIGTGSTWSTRPFAVLTQVNGLACVSNSFCVAAGSASGQVSSVGSLEIWNGSSWSSSYSGGNSFSSVSCPSTTSCFAAGYSGNNGVVEVWNGSTWSSATVSTTSGRLSGISCPAPSSCVAVGGNGSLVFNGHSWLAVGLAPGGAGQFSLNSVSCATSTYCIAVGSVLYKTYGSALTVTEQWNGMQWSVLPSANLATGTNPPVGSGAGGGILTAVSCTASDACAAVGYGGGGGSPAVAIVETWDGTAWSTTPNAAPIEPSGVGAALRAVSCVPTSGAVACSAVGSQTNPSAVESPLVESTPSAIGSLRAVTVSLTESAGNLSTMVSPTSGSGTPTGTVTLLSGGSLIGSCPPVVLNGSSGATCSAGTASGPYAVEYSGDATFDGAIATLSAGSSPPPGSISGTVSSGGSPLSDVCVYAFLGNNSFEAITSSDGSYAIEDLTPGSYHVEFDPTCSDTQSSSDAIQYYSGKSDLASATPVVVTAQQATTGIGAALAAGAAISGTVTSNSSAVGNVCAIAIVKATGYIVNLAATASDGSYTIANLPAGTYVVFFDPTCLGTIAGDQLAEEFDGPSTSFNGATAITVSASGDQTNENIDLPLGATISGSVTAQDALNSAGVCVELLDSTSGNLATLTLGRTAADGSYSIFNVPPGSYELQVDPTCLKTQRSDFSMTLMGGSPPKVWSIAAGADYVMNDTIAASNAPVISTTPLPGGSVGSQYSAAVSVSGGTSAFTWSATGLPQGLSINPNSGQIAGTPAVAGPFTVDVTVRDSSTPPYSVEATLSGDITPTPEPPPTPPSPPTSPPPSTTNPENPAPPQVSILPPTAIVPPSVIAAAPKIAVAMVVKSPPKSVTLGAVATYTLTLTPKSGKQPATGLIDVTMPIRKKIGKKTITVNETLTTARVHGKSMKIGVRSATLGVGRHTITISYSAGSGFKSTSVVEHLVVKPKPHVLAR